MSARRLRVGDYIAVRGGVDGVVDQIHAKPTWRMLRTTYLIRRSDGGEPDGEGGYYPTFYPVTIYSDLT
jgi:hypothetical protein